MLYHELFEVNLVAVVVTKECSKSIFRQFGTSDKWSHRPSFNGPSPNAKKNSHTIISMERWVTIFDAPRLLIANDADSIEWFEQNKIRTGSIVGGVGWQQGWKIEKTFYNYFVKEDQLVDEDHCFIIVFNRKSVIWFQNSVNKSFAADTSESPQQHLEDENLHFNQQNYKHIQRATISKPLKTRIH